VVAQDVAVTIKVPEGIRPVRVLGNDSEISGQNVHINLSQIYSRQEKYVVLEVEVPAGEDKDHRRLADVAVTYRNMKSHDTDRLTGKVAVTFSDSTAAVEESLNKDVMEDVIALVANEQNKLATSFLDQGDLLKCRETLISNAAFLEENAKKLGSDRLLQYYDLNVLQANQVEQRDTNRARKAMRASQIQLDIQQNSAQP
jgi:Ca-activated chloride channel family protein